MVSNRIFADTNILLDVIEKREDFWEHSLSILDFDEREIYITAMSVPNIFYITRKIKGLDLWSFFKPFKIVPLDKQLIDKARMASTPDLEDNIQIVSCMEVSDTFITRNKQDFADYDDVLNIYTPEEYLQELAKLN